MNLNRFILFLQNVDGIGDSSIRKLIFDNQFDNLDLKSLEDVLGWIKNHSSYFAKKEAIQNLTIDDLKKANVKRKNIEEKSNELGINYISFFDDNYPRRAKKLSEEKSSDYPVLLFYKGDVSVLNNDKICAVIGTRKPSEKAIAVASDLTKHFAQKGYVIVSGLAEGCDSLAHTACLKESGKTIAILGTGLDTIFPSSNESLAKEIVEKGGLLISEYPVGFKGAAYSFVQRDRLQAAFSDIVLPIQTSLNGGTMHAAKASTTKYNRKLMVVSPTLIDDGDFTGNKALIDNYGGVELLDFSAVE